MRLLLALVLLLSVNYAKADAWDNLTQEQATHVKHFLHKNPFIFDFCDCCGNEVEVYLIKVESAEIIPCIWDKKQFSVLTKGRRIAKMKWATVGIDDYHTDVVDEEVEYTIYMNYTFVYDKHMKWAVPFHKLIDYNSDGPICIGATNYPNPDEEGVLISDEDYIDWYHQHIKQAQD